MGIFSRRRVRTPSLLQMEAVECGAASLGMILAYHGKIVPLAELRRECGVSRDGSNAASLAKAARRYGLDTKGYSKDTEACLALRPPYIVFWGFNHFLVVEGRKGDKVFLNDPAVGHRKVSMEEFEDEFTGVVLTMSPDESFEKGGRSPGLLPAFRDRLKGFWGAVLFAAGAGFLLVIPGLMIPAFTQIFLDQVLIQGHDDWLQPLIFAMFVATLVLGVLKLLQLTVLRRLRLSLAAKMSAQFFRHLLRLPVDFYSQRYAGEIGDRSSLNDKVAGILSGQLAQTAIDLVMMVFYAGLMFFYNAQLTLVGIVCAALNAFALQRFSKWRVEANMRLLQEYGKVSGASIAGLQSMETIKASGMESGFFLRWAGHFANASNTRMDIEFTNAFLGIVPRLLSTAATMAVLVLGGYYVIDGRMTIGGLVAFQLLMRSFLRPVAGLVYLGQTIQDLRGDMARLDDVLAHPQDASLASTGNELVGDGASANGNGQPVSQDTVRLQGYIELRDISFGYNPLAPPLIENFNLRLKPGQRVALVGGSGSGKSTIAKLVTGLYQPWEGQVLFDDVPRGELAPSLLANSLSMVDQDLIIFGGSVRENLTLWDTTVPDHLLGRACQDAEISDRVHALAGGFDAELNEGGGNLSGGERQRLEIARALVNDPSVLVLDEATSALDTESERLIVERIGLRGCSCLVVAHRLSTIRDCDEIIVLDHGKVVERGSHDELWKLDGVYAGLLRADGGDVG